MWFYLGVSDERGLNTGKKNYGDYVLSYFNFMIVKDFVLVYQTITMKFVFLIFAKMNNFEKCKYCSKALNVPHSDKQGQNINPYS